jgi:hypothetical protein
MIGCERKQSLQEVSTMVLQRTGRLSRAAHGIVTCALLLMLAGTAQAQQHFDNPDQAFSKLLTALEADDRKAIVEIFGSEYESKVVTVDWDADRAKRDRIATAALEKQAVVKVTDDRVEWVVGTESWPFPVQLVLGEDKKWAFDTAGGLETLIDRRIGRDELTAISIVDAYVDAQIQYALSDHDGDGVYEYAQRLASTEGKQDGLYWKAAEGEPESPFGPLVRGAESYLDTVAKGDPIRGYYFRILTRQGAHPPGGEYDYVINGHMIAGFALVAYPAEYETTGIMTFVVNQAGDIFQKDIGPFDGMSIYDPDDSWTPVEP